MSCRRSSPTAGGCRPSKQEPDEPDGKREKCGSPPTATTSAHSPGPPALASANTASEAEEGEGKESGCPPSLTGAASSNLAGSAAPDRANDRDPETEDGDRFEAAIREDGSAAASVRAATGRPPSASSTTAAAAPPVEGRRAPAFNFSFAMGGWLMFYSFGVAKCLLDHGLHKVRPMQQSFIGSSAGSLAAAALALEADIDKASVRLFRFKTACAICAEKTLFLCVLKSSNNHIDICPSCSATAVTRPTAQQRYKMTLTGRGYLLTLGVEKKIAGHQHLHREGVKCSV